MGNISRASVKRTLTPELVDAALADINERLFGGFFRIKGYEVMWEFHIEGQDYPLWVFHQESPRRIGGKRPHPPHLWADWAWNKFLGQLCARFGGVMTDEGIPESLDPADYADRTFEEHIDKRYDAWADQEATERFRKHDRNKLPEALRKYAGTIPA